MNLQVRETAFKALLPLALAQPEVLLPHWSELAGLLKSEKAFAKYPAVHLLAALVPADRERRFDRSFNAFFSLLEDDAISVAAHVARLAGPIARARPDLEPRITRRLLALDKSHFDPGRRDLVKSYALEAFGAYFDHSARRASMLSFARAMSTSKKSTRGKSRQDLPQGARTGLSLSAGSAVRGAGESEQRRGWSGGWVGSQVVRAAPESGAARLTIHTPTRIAAPPASIGPLIASPSMGQASKAVTRGPK